MEDVALAGRSKYASQYAEKNLNFQRFNGFYCDFLYSFWNIWYLLMWKSDFSTYFDTIDVKKLRLFQGYFPRVNRYKFWNHQVAGLPTYKLYTFYSPYHHASLDSRQILISFLSVTTVMPFSILAKQPGLKTLCEKNIDFFFFVTILRGVKNGPLHCLACIFVIFDGPWYCNMLSFIRLLIMQSGAASVYKENKNKPKF